MQKESEKSLEVHLVNAVKARGGLAIKNTSQFHRGLPDRAVLLPGGHISFVEMKSTGCKPTALQLRAHEQLRHMGFRVEVIDTTEKLDAFLNSLPK